MILSALLLLLQAVPDQTAEAAVESVDQAVDAAESPEADAPRTKRVCRRVLDTSTGHIAKSRKVCREVPDEPTAG